MRRGSVWVALAVALALAAGDAAAVAPKADIVGQIVLVSGGGFDLVTIYRGGKPVAVHRYEPVYAGDRVVVRGRRTSALIEFRGGHTQLIPGGAEPFYVPSMNSGPWSLESIDRVMAGFPGLFDPPARKRREETLPAPWRGGVVRASPWLPASEQVVTASDRAIVLPLVWAGDKAEATLRSETGSLIARAAPDQAGRASLYCPMLEPGRYVLKISAGKSEIEIPVRAAPAPTRTEDETAATIRVAEALKGPPAGRLQALADLSRLADTNFVAFALTRQVFGEAPRGP